MVIRIKTFASVADACGFREKTMTVSDNCTAGSVFETLLEEFPTLSSLKDVVMVAVNEEHAGLEAKLSDGDELAFFPPVSGG